MSEMSNTITFVMIFRFES